MPFDLMLSEHGDLVFSATRDLQGVGGEAQVKQSIRTRLKIPRGSWDYDDDGTLGSMLYTLSGSHPGEIQMRAAAFVRDALRGMDEIAVDDVGVEIVDNNLSVTVYYHMVGTTGDIADSGAGVTFSLPAGG